MSDEIELKDLHEVLLSTMKELHRFLGINKLKYVMIGGSMLGAYRHKGFIPWDDDIDIAMPRKDFQRLIEMSKSRNDLPFDIACYYTDEKFPYPFIRIYNKKTTLITGMHNCVGGVFIDILACDYVGDSKIEAIIFYKTIISNLKKLHRYVREDGYHCVSDKNIYRILTRRGNIKSWNNLINKIMGYRKSGNYCACFHGTHNTKEIYKKEMFFKRKKYKFEDTFFYGVNDPKLYLSQLYGEDYMKLPDSIERNNLKHRYKYINLNKPYKEYIEENKVLNNYEK